MQMIKFGSFLLFLFLFVIPHVLADLQVDFYKSTCPQAESIVEQVVKNEFSRDPSITAAFLRESLDLCENTRVCLDPQLKVMAKSLLL